MPAPSDPDGHMCGINGIFAYQTAAEDPSERELLATRDHMARRGPDGFGAWRSQDRRCALGHRRLSIVDLSTRALQPMTDESGDLVVTFNGEIYNFPELRAELEAKGRRFRTTSDTEALLHLYALHGAGMVRHLRGMYAFPLYAIHAPLLNTMAVLDPRNAAQPFRIAYWIVMTTLIVTLAWAAERFFDVPVRRWLDRRTRRPAGHNP